MPRSKSPADAKSNQDSGSAESDQLGMSPVAGRTAVATDPRTETTTDLGKIEATTDPKT